MIRKLTRKLRGNLIVDNYKDIIKPTDKVIDIGCGSGYIANRIKELSSNIECADIANILEGRYFLNYYHQIKNFKIKSAYKSFDIAMINHTLHHIKKENQIKMIMESERISKKVIIVEADLSFLVWITEIMDKKDMPCPMSHRSLEEWKTYLKDYTYVKMKTPFYYPVKNFMFVKEVR